MAAFDKMKQGMKDAAWEATEEFLKLFIEEIGIRIEATPAGIRVWICDDTNNQYEKYFSLKDAMMESCDLNDSVNFEGCEKTGRELFIQGLEECLEIAKRE